MQSSPSHSNTWYVYLAVIMSGAAVLALELLGTRLLAPFCGADIYLWSALISVTLIALSCGYALGGRFADKGPNLLRLALLIGLAGIWIVAIPWLRLPLFSLAQSIDLRIGVMLIALILFFPPMALLGMVSPYAIRLRAASVETVGTTAGNLYAISTVASVVAALATGFILIPSIGVPTLVFVIGLLLIVTAAIGRITQSKTKGAIAALLILAVTISLWFFASPKQAANPESGLLAVETSAYADLRVVERDSVRYLLVDGGTHSSVDVLTLQTHMSYVNVLNLTRNYFDKTGTMLTVGLGGGSVAKGFAQKGWKVDAVEIDPVVTKLAHEYFGLAPKECQTYEMDGRQYLTTHTNSYDVIILDAYGSSYIPFHLVTKEAFALAKSRLNTDGILALNVECVGWNDPLVASLAKTIGESFKNVVALPIVEPPDQFGNLVLFASDQSLELAQAPPVPIDRFSLEYDQAHAWDNRFKPEIATSQILTDNLNPVDSWSGRINRAARAFYHSSLDTRGIAW
jgi:spermidine synthase